MHTCERKRRVEGRKEKKKASPERFEHSRSKTNRWTTRVAGDPVNHSGKVTMQISLNCTNICQSLGSGRFSPRLRKDVNKHTHCTLYILLRGVNFTKTMSLIHLNHCGQDATRTLCICGTWVECQLEHVRANKENFTIHNFSVCSLCMVSVEQAMLLKRTVECPNLSRYFLYLNE